MNKALTMRRSDREVVDKDEIADFIGTQQIIRVGFADGGEVYIVPVNYGFDISDGNFVFYFHGAKAGRKYELAKKSPDVGFEIDGGYQLMPSETACGYSAHFKSVIGSGRLDLIEDNNEKIHALGRIMAQVSGRADWEFSGQMLSETAVFRLEVRSLTCKAK
ncbi:pyridoxamine 5'-phosphate oxidase family protein [Ruminococcus albus]|nr:pyridoxamine 5'-phosphate oxidase family protein [Ruminococcus albus]